MAEKHSGGVCVHRTQALQDGFHDEFCKRCWEEDEELQRCYPDREECFEEHVVTGVEVVRMPKRRLRYE